MWRRDEGASAADHDVAVGSECQLAPEGRAVQAYNQEAFHYFLALERTRAGRSNRRLLLVLASVLPRAPFNGWRMDPRVAQKLFAGLWLSTRDADFIGWYRDGRSAGAVLTQRAKEEKDESGNVSRQIRTRVEAALHAELPRSVRQTLRIHVFHLMPKVTEYAGADDRLARTR